MDDKETLLTRRNAIQGAAALLGGTLAAAQLGAFMGRAAQAAAADSTTKFFDSNQFALVERAVDIIIPETETPGALSAGVHRLVDLMLADWASPDRQARYVAGLRDIDARMRELGAESFVAATPRQQLELLQALDVEANADGSGDTFFGEFKKLTLFAYYSSEAGATIELNYEALIPDYRACALISEIGGRAWFWLGFSHGL